MNIGHAAKASGVSAKMVRYYESVGLIPEAPRSKAGYRTYSESDVHTLRFIRRARDLGFRVNEIANLVSLWRDQSRRSADVKTLVVGHISALKCRIAEMEAMVDTLSDLAESCQGDQRAECPILRDLENPNPDKSMLHSERGKGGAIRPTRQGKSGDVAG